MLVACMTLFLFACGGEDEPTFTHTIGGVGFVADENWEVTDQGGGAIFIVADDNSIVINVLGPHNVNPDSDLESILRVMVEQSYGGQNIEIQGLSEGELGYAVYRANYTFQEYPGIAFMVSDEEQLVFVNGVLVAETAELIDSYLNFIASIRFVD